MMGCRSQNHSAGDTLWHTLIGLEHIALGSDHDGGVTTQFDTSGLAVLTQTMLNQGFTETEIRAVMGENVKRFLMEQLPE